MLKEETMISVVLSAGPMKSSRWHHRQAKTQRANKNPDYSDKWRINREGGGGQTNQFTV